MSYKLAGVIWNDVGTVATIPTEESKPLEAFEKIKVGSCRGKFKEYCNIVEEELKRSNELEKELQLKSFSIDVLEKKIKEKDQLINDIAEVKLKQDEVLQILKEKNVCIHDLKKSKTLKEYSGCRVWEEELTQQEYDLLKEVLQELEIKREVIKDILTADDEKKFKAFEIIKEKGVDVGWLKRISTLSEYNNVIGTSTHKLLTQEDFDLLKRYCYEINKENIY